jgi:hypothetical protein
MKIQKNINFKLKKIKLKKKHLKHKNKQWDTRKKNHTGLTKGDHFLFGSVFIKKNNQTKIFKKKPNQNRFKPTSFSSVF